MASKLHWRVAEKATGSYRSFQSRAWPTAYTARNEEFIIAGIYSPSGEDYHAAKARTGQHALLKVRLAIRDEARQDIETHKWIVLKAEFATLEEAKAGALAFFNQHHDKFITEKVNA